MNKKVLSIAVTTLLVLSIVAAAAPAFAAPSNIVVQTYNPGTGALTPFNPATDTVTVGTILQVSGDGANAYGPITAYWDTAVTAGILNSTTAADRDGNWEFQVTIPSSVNGIHDLIVRDDIGGTGSVQIEVSESLRRSTSRALPGDSITLTGHGFDATDTVTITIVAPNGTSYAMPPNVAANGTGSFSLTTTIPTILTVADYSSTPWTITATQGALSATATVTLDYYVTVKPTSGPMGITIGISGRIPANTDVTVTFGTTTAFTTTSGPDGRFTGSYDTTDVPLVPTATYAVVASWGPVGAQEDRSATFEVNADVPEIELKDVAGDPIDVAEAGTVITITATGFSDNADVTLLFGTTEVNSTATDDRFGPTDDTGEFTAEFTVPALGPGAYTVTLRDEFGATDTVTFTIATAALTVIDSRATSYVQGDTISFTITSTNPGFTSPRLTIRAPSGVVFWSSIELDVTDITTTNHQVYYQDQVDDNYNRFTLPSDAPIGTWNWTITYTDSLGAHTTSVTNWATGTFTVSVGGTSGVIGSIESIKDDIATIKTSVGTTLSTDVSSIKGTVTSIQNSIASLSIPDLGTITTKLTDIDSVLAYVAGDVATIKTTIGTFEATLDEINTKVTSIEGDVATVQTDIGTLQGTVTSISGNVATIQTDIDTLQADVSGLQGDMSSLQNDVGDSTTATGNLTPLIIVAIVLALIAAIAAIASIVLMRRKIAG
ncbi:MAG: hypothetical protein NWF00_04305 [Candidatus Bathyarchaeota archaeon]|nr:hypothetical protein [Candidatus Bathyarchaeota archaeon]